MICRGAKVIASDVDAVLGRSRFLTDDAAGARVEGTSHDFLVRACDYQNLGCPTTPQKLDRIQRTANGRVYTYEVMSPPYDLHDVEGLVLRVHTMLVSIR